MGETFQSHFTNEHEMLFYEGISNQSYSYKNGKEKIPLTIKNQEILKGNITSPEFNLFHMASPELERLIVGHGSNVETSINTNRETTTINSSDLNVLNLVSPDFEKIFANFNDKDSGRERTRSVEEQHEVYTKTFVDALHKIQGQQKEVTNKNNPSVRNTGHNGSKAVNASFDYQHVSQQFMKTKGNEEQFVRGQDSKVQGENIKELQLNYVSFASLEDKNKNKIGINEHYQFVGKTRRQDSNRNTIRSNERPSTISIHNNTTNPQVQDCNRSGQTNISNRSNPSPSRFMLEDSNRNTIRVNTFNQPNRGERINPHSSEIGLESHPELFKLHAHVKLSENMRDSMDKIPHGQQDVYPTPQIFPLPPIDLQVQEIVKRERKKQKNRVAASKCRKKKLEREAQLEVRVQELRERNIELTTLASALKSQLNDLKQHVMEHIACGCHVTVY